MLCLLYDRLLKPLFPHFEPVFIEGLDGMLEVRQKIDLVSTSCTVFIGVFYEARDEACG